MSLRSSVVVAGSTPKVNVTFDYADESDAGPYPIPPSPPIEGGNGSSGDRHILMIDRDNWMLYELYAAYPPASPGQPWTAGSGPTRASASSRPTLPRR